MLFHSGTFLIARAKKCTCRTEAVVPTNFIINYETKISKGLLNVKINQSCLKSPTSTF